MTKLRIIFLSIFALLSTNAFSYDQGPTPWEVAMDLSRSKSCFAKTMGLSGTLVGVGGGATGAVFSGYFGGLLTNDFAKSFTRMPGLKRNLLRVGSGVIVIPLAAFIGGYLALELGALTGILGSFGPAIIVQIGCTVSKAIKKNS